jgi:nucleotide-binding universal stress UspA family protein
MRILIGYDGSPPADQAIEDLARAGLPARGDALVLCVADVLAPPPGPGGQPASPAHAKAQRAATAAVEAAKKLTGRGVELTGAALAGWSVTGEAVADSPFWGLVKRAEVSRADLVVVGAQGKSAIGRLVLGSVSQTVVRNATCSVRLGRMSRRQGHEPARLVVGVDGSRGSAAAVAALAERRWPAGSTVAVAAALDAATATALASSVDPFVLGWSMPEDEDPRSWIDRAVAAAIAELERAGLAATAWVASGEPQRVLVEHAEQIDADCIFVGAQGLTRAERLLLGSVSAGVAARAHCSVEVVRR